MPKRLILAVAAIFCAAASAQVTVAPILQPHQTFVDGSGVACSGCSLWSYAAGTTTPLATYTDASGTSTNPNPVVLDSSGGANIWLASSSAYKFVLVDAAGTTVWTVDQVHAVSSSYCALNGCTLTGPLVLPADPTADYQAATKHYADAIGTTATAANTTANNAVPKAGGTMLGPLILSGDPTASTGASTKNYADTSFQYNAAASGVKCDGTTDDTAALQSALTNYGGIGVRLPGPNKTCVIAGSAISFGEYDSLNLNGDTLDLTNSSSVTCAAGSGGILQVYQPYSQIYGGTITSTSNAACLINASHSGFGAGVSIHDIIFNGNANANVCIYAGNQSTLHIFHNDFNYCGTNAIQIPQTTNGAVIELNRFQNGTAGSPYINITYSTTDLDIHQNTFEIYPAVNVSETNNLFSVRIRDNWCGDGSPGANDPYCFQILGTAATLIDHNYIQGPTSGIVIGSASQSSSQIPQSTRIENNIVYGVTNGIVDYGANTSIENNSLSTATTYGLNEEGTSAVVSQNSFISAALNFGTSGHIILPNYFFSASTTCAGQNLFVGQNAPSGCGNEYFNPQPVTSFVPQPGAGTGATAVCASGASCSTKSGVITLTTGTGSMAAGSQVLVNWPASLPYLAGCSASIASSASTAYIVTSTTAAIQIGVTSALSNSTAYTVSYTCP